VAVTEYVIESDRIMKPLKDRGLLTAEPFDQPIDFTYFELWHHWGRTASSAYGCRGQTTPSGTACTKC